MGCKSSSSSKVINSLKPKVFSKQVKYLIKVQPPNTDPYLQFQFFSQQTSIKLSQLMSLLSQDPSHKTTIDANFISRLNKRGDRRLYYVQKLIGVQMQDEQRPSNGKTWVVYVNHHRKDWTQACESDFKVFPIDEVLWKFEQNEDLSDDESYIFPIKY